MRPLLIDESSKARVRELRAFAQGNVYRPGQSETIPGDDARHVVKFFQGYRCVFSYTEHGGKMYRHLSVSVDGEQFAHPIAAFTLATEFGFTGWEPAMGEQLPPVWMARINKEEHCVVLIQELSLKKCEPA